MLDWKRGVLRIRVDSEDDLWLLSMLISPGDLVKGLTVRDVSLGYEKRKVPMVLTLRVQKTEFQPFTNRLRIHGIVVEGPDRFGVKGSHHTINVDVGHEITVFKAEWSPQILNELLKLVRPIKVVLVALDFDEYAIAVVQSQGMKIVDEKTISLPISDDRLEHEKQRVVEQVAKRIVEVCAREGIDVVIIGSPTALRDEVRERVLELNPKLKVYTDTVANGGYAGVQELLRRDVVRRVLQDLSVEEAEQILDEFNLLLVKNDKKVAYGVDHVEIAASIGAVEKLVVVDDMLSSFGDDRLRIEKILRMVAESRGKIVIVPASTPPGQRIKMMGGVIAILRYPIDLDSVMKSVDSGRYQDAN